jgi:hypothetical protein
MQRQQMELADLLVCLVVGQCVHRRGIEGRIAVLVEVIAANSLNKVDIIGRGRGLGKIRQEDAKEELLTEDVAVLGRKLIHQAELDLDHKVHGKKNHLGRGERARHGLGVLRMPVERERVRYRAFQCVPFGQR